jgi:hypothetical protein
MRRFLTFLVALLAVGVASVSSAREEQLMITETRAITIHVPDGFIYKSGINKLGEVGVTLTHTKEQASLTITFSPDAEGAFSQARARKEKLHDEFKSYVDGSVEKAMRFEELEPKVGAGTFCLFTDEKLVGKTEYPEGEYLHLVVGVKAWAGVVATFTLFSNDAKGESHQAVMKTLRESVHEKPAPLL